MHKEQSASLPSASVGIDRVLMDLSQVQYRFLTIITIFSVLSLYDQVVNEHGWFSNRTVYRRNFLAFTIYNDLQVPFKRRFTWAMYNRKAHMEIRREK